MALPALLLGLIPSVVKLIGGGIKGLFGYKEKKLDLAVLKETNDASLQLAWWDYLKSQKSTLVNQVIRPLTMLYFIGDYAYQRIAHNAYEMIIIIPQMNVGDLVIGPIYNGHILLFVIFFMFPLRFLEKVLMKKD